MCIWWAPQVDCAIFPAFALPSRSASSRALLSHRKGGSFLFPQRCLSQDASHVREQPVRFAFRRRRTGVVTPLEVAPFKRKFHGFVTKADAVRDRQHCCIVAETRPPCTGISRNILSLLKYWRTAMRRQTAGPSQNYDEIQGDVS
jgi:hypothetical protein